MSSSKSRKKWKDRVLEDFLKRSNITEGSVCEFHDKTTITTDPNDVPLRRERIYEKTVYRTSKIDRKNCKPHSKTRAEMDKIDGDVSMDQRGLIAEIDRQLEHLQCRKRCLQQARKCKQSKTWSEHLSANQPGEKQRDNIQNKFTERHSRRYAHIDNHICEVLHNLLEKNRVRVTDSSTQMKSSTNLRTIEEKCSQSPRTKIGSIYNSKHFSQNVQMTSNCSLVSLVSFENGSAMFLKRAQIQKVNSSTQTGSTFQCAKRRSPCKRKPRLDSCFFENRQDFLPKKVATGPQPVKTNMKTRVVTSRCKSLSPKATYSISRLSIEKDSNKMLQRKTKVTEEIGTLGKCRASSRSKALKQRSPRRNLHSNQANLHSSRITVKSQHADSAKFEQTPRLRSESSGRFSSELLKARQMAYSTSRNSERTNEVTFKQSIKKFNSISKHGSEESSISILRVNQTSQKRYKNESGRSSARDATSVLTPSQKLSVVKPKCIDDTTYVCPDNEETDNYIILPYVAKTKEEEPINYCLKEQRSFSKITVNKSAVLMEDASSRKSQTNSSISFDLSLKIKSIEVTNENEFIAAQTERPEIGDISIDLDSETGSQHCESQATCLISESSHKTDLNESLSSQGHEMKMKKFEDQAKIHKSGPSQQGELIISVSASKEKTEDQLPLKTELNRELSASPQSLQSLDNQNLSFSPSNQDITERKYFKSEPLPESSQSSRNEARDKSHSSESTRETHRKTSKSAQYCTLEERDNLSSQWQPKDAPKADCYEIFDNTLPFNIGERSTKDSKTENKSLSDFKIQKTDPVPSRQEPNLSHPEIVSSPPESLQNVSKKQQPLPKVATRKPLSSCDLEMSSSRSTSLKSESPDDSKCSKTGEVIEYRKHLSDESHISQPKASSPILTTLDLHSKDNKPFKSDLGFNVFVSMPRSDLQTSSASQASKNSLYDTNDHLPKFVESENVSSMVGTSQDDIFLSETRNEEMHVEGIDPELLNFIRYLQGRLRDCDEMVRRQKLKCQKERKESYQNSVACKPMQQAPNESFSSEQSWRSYVVPQIPEMKAENYSSTFKQEKTDKPKSPLGSCRTSESELHFENSCQTSGCEENTESNSDRSEIPPFTGCDCMKEDYYKIMHIAYGKL